MAQINIGGSNAAVQLQGYTDSSITTDQTFTFPSTGGELAINGGGGGGNSNGADVWGSVNSDGTKNGAGFNFASSTKTGTGEYDIVFTTALSTSNYSVQATSVDGLRYVATASNLTTSGCTIKTYDINAGSQKDNQFTFAVFASNAIAPQYGVGADAAVKMNANGTSAPIIKYGYNIKEAKRTGIGEYEIFFNTPMPTSQYAVTLSSNGGKVASLSGTQTDKFIVLVQNPDGVPAEGNVCADVHASSTITPTYTWTRDGTVLKPANSGDKVNLSRSESSNPCLNVFTDGVSDPTIQLFAGGSITAAGGFTIQSDSADVTKQVFITSSDSVSGGYYRQRVTAGLTTSDVVFRIQTGIDTDLFTVDGQGNSTFSNTTLRLDPDDPSKVLDVKASIRTMQSALYRLKAAVLIPDTSVDQLRLRILEALETITEEVD